MSIQTKNCPALAISLAMAGNLRAERNNPNTGWFSRAKYGVFIHFLPSSQEGLNQVEEFDAKELFGHRAGRSPGNLRLIAFHWGTGIRRQAREAALTTGPNHLRTL
jgi:hypothetical protein